MNTDFTKLCKKLDNYFLEASVDELEIIYFMLHTELLERDRIQGLLTEQYPESKL